MAKSDFWLSIYSVTVPSLFSGEEVRKKVYCPPVAPLGFIFKGGKTGYVIKK